MRHPGPLLLASLLATTLATAEPTVGANGWSNIPGMLEGTLATRAVDTTLPRPPLGFVEYLPLGYNDPANASAAWPLVVFISGLGEVGDGTDTEANSHQLLVNMTRHGPFRQVVTAQWDFPAIVVAVQPPGYWNNATILKPVFEYLKANYRVDQRRMYLTGLCDGAVGVLNFASQNPGYLAGILPIEGGSDPLAGMAAMIKDLPMWAVHCFNDTDIARTSSILWVDQATQAEDTGALGVMSTYPGYDGKSFHMAVDSDPATNLPLDRFGPTMVVPVSTLTSSSTWLSFGATTFGSAMFNSWNGTDAWPYARVHLGAPIDRGAKAGVMFRDSTAPGAQFILVAQGPNNEVFMQWRSATDGACGSGVRSGGRESVKWVRLERSGATFTGSYSVDGASWTSLGSRTMSFANSSYLAGLAVTPHDNRTTWTQAFTGVTIAGVQPTELIDIDIGSPGQPGSATFADGRWTVVGGGADIWTTADQFNYAHALVEGDQSILAKVGENAVPLVIALGKPDGVFLTSPYAGPTAVQDIYIQLPVGYNNTAYYDAGTSAWAWQRNQNWDRSRADKRIFTMSWYKNHVQGWVDTYSNGGCWDWLFSQQLPVAPQITTEPQSVAVTVGHPATFAVLATGTPPLTYLWMRGGVVLDGVTGAACTIDPTIAGDSGAGFTATITNAAGAVTSTSAILTVLPLPPVIVVQPQAQSVPDGQSATFLVSADGAPPLTYRWTRDGVDVPGATTSAYTTGATSMSDNGISYAVVVGNPGGAITSADAILSITAVGPAIVTHPTDRAVTVGQVATFTVVVSGSPVLVLQWQRSSPGGGAWGAIPGATLASYSTTMAVAGDDGTRFRCRAGNGLGEVTSDPAGLAVSPIVAGDSSAGGSDGGGGGSCGIGMAGAVILCCLSMLGLHLRSKRRSAR